MASSHPSLAPSLSPSPDDPHFNFSSVECDGLPHSLEELLNDCFHLAIAKDSLSAKRTAHVEDFHRYVKELHCQENLSFIIEICRYRYYYERTFPERGSTETVQPVSSSYVNQSLEQLIQDLPNPTANAKKHQRKTSFRSQSNSSMTSVTGAPFALEFDDALSDKHDAWDYLSNQYVRDSDSDSESEFGDFDDHSIVKHQWEYILDTFIHDKSPCQVNLTNQTLRSVQEQSAYKEKIHHPSVLSDAYCEVVDLIHGNVYGSFMKKIECPDTALPSSVKSSSPKVASRNSCQAMTGSAPSSLNSHSCCPGKTEQPCLVKPGSHVIAPVPSKKRSKFLSTFSSSSSSEVSPVPSSLGHFLGHLKPQSSSRIPYSPPQSPLSHPPASRETSPIFKINEENMIPRSRSTVVPEENHSSSFINKLWRKKK